MKKLLLILVGLGTTISAFSQSISQNGCGTLPTEAQMERIHNYVASGESARAKGTAGVDSIPLSIHIVGKTNGSGYYNIDLLLPLICELNKDFAPADFFFYVKWPLHYINDDNYYEHDFSGGYQMMAGNNISNSVNVYFVQDPAGNCGYFSPGADGVAIGKNCAGTNSTTLTHELGHFFDLPHTFSGWENGNTPPGSAIENVARIGVNANCNSAGDGFCDTDPDYVSYRWNCPYSGPVLTDKTGSSVTPDETLYMSYSDDACTNRFSPQQIGAMQNNLSNFRSNLLTGNSMPYSTLSNPNINYPLAFMYSNDKTIRWNKVPGAEYYRVKVAPTSLPALIKEQWFTTDTFAQVTFPIANAVNYTVIVTPHSSKNTCGLMTTSHPFTYTSALGVNDMDMTAANFNIGPNPSDDQVSINVSDLKRGGYALVVTNITGQVILKQQFAHNGGLFNTSLRTADFTNGIYFLKISGNNISYTTKLVVKH